MLSLSSPSLFLFLFLGQRGVKAESMCHDKCASTAGRVNHFSIGFGGAGQEVVVVVFIIALPGVRALYQGEDWSCRQIFSSV